MRGLKRKEKPEKKKPAKRVLRMRNGKKVRRIKDKLLQSIMPAVVLTIVVLVFISSLLTRTQLQRMAEGQLEASISNQSDNISSWLDENLEFFATAKAAIETAKPQTEEEWIRLLDTFYGFNSNSPNGLFVASQSGTFYKAAEADINTKEPTKQEWFKQGLTRIQMAYGAPYKTDDGTDVISASGIINDGSDDIKVAAADVTLDRISIIVNSGVKMDNASSFLVDTSTNTILAHRDSSMVATNLSGSNEMMEEVVASLANKDYSTKQAGGYTLAFSEVFGTDWVLVSTIENKIIMQDIVRLVWILVIVGFVAVVFISILIRFIVSRVIAPIGPITDNIGAMSSGDFTINVEHDSNDEIGLMGDEVDEFVGSMRDMLASINTESERLKTQSDNSSRVSQDMYDASQSQEEAMENLNNTVEQLSAAVNEIAEAATTLAMVVSDTKTSSDAASKSMTETVEFSSKGRSDMEKLSKAMEGIQNANDGLVESINKVGDASEEITGIVAMIGDIAEETNLLSLNASIEAARAGEAGRGFAVVATEIGGLANNSAASAQNISNLIHEIRALIDDVVAQARNSAKSIRENSELIEAAVKTFDLIYTNIQSTSECIDEMIAGVSKVDEVAATVAAISEEQAASADEILETSQSMVEKAQSITQSSQDVADNSQELAETSDTLTGYVKRFKIDKEPSTVQRTRSVS
ncbi:MAG: methyl-accepting chemotaxis protein [Lachnospiraceae bacterium]|nr:methyl-accepting chemotaxis protein [Lachnospiraceae bacterium]